jgi:serine/threonine protein kinase
VHKSATCIVIYGLDHGQQRKEEAKEERDGENPEQPAARRVALKFMKNKDQWLQEQKMRNGSGGSGAVQALDPRYVIDVLQAHDGAEDAQFGQDLENRQLRDYPFVLVMPRAERSLADVLQHEHLAPSPDEVHWEEVRAIAQDTALALQHLHQFKIIHGDIKPVRRVSLLYFSLSLVKVFYYFFI